MALPVLNATGLITAEPTSSYKSVSFQVTLDQVATAPVKVSYYFQDGSASAATGDYGADAGTLTIPAGQQSGTISTTVGSDAVAEGVETFQLVLTTVSNATFAGGAAALIATGTIVDNGSVTPGMGAAASPVLGPASASTTLPTIAVNDVAVIEGNSSYKYARFLVTLDKTPTAPVTLSWYTQDGTASDRLGDYTADAGTLSLAAGQQSSWITVAVNADTAIEGDQTFQLVLTDATNAVFARAAPALVATATIIDDDNGAVDAAGGVGAAGATVGGPASASNATPTISIASAAKSEGNASYAYERFLVTLDRAPTAPVTVNWATQDGTASARLGDYSADGGTLTFNAGDQSAWISVAVNGDTQIEPNESFYVVLSGARGAVLAQNAPALVAVGTIVEDDNGPPTLAGGLGGPGAVVLGPADNPAAPPAVSVVSTSYNEGNSSYGYAEVYVLLSHASTTPVTLKWTTADGSATSSGDYSADSGTLTIPAGTLSAYVPVAVRADTLIEGDESFGVNFTNLAGASFAGGAATASATVTIRDDDGGGSAGQTAAGPQFAFASAFAPAVSSVLRLSGVTGAGGAYANTLAQALADGSMTAAQAYQNVVATAINTSAVATLSYEFFTGRTPGAAGMDYLVSPTGPNPNNLNSAYYQSFNLENRYINFAVNLGKLGEGAAAFNATYGSLSLFDSTKAAYGIIFGATPTDEKIHAILDTVLTLNGQSFTRAQYFATYGGDGVEGIGTKAAAVGFLLTEAEKADLGLYVKSNDAFLLDVAQNTAAFGVDIVGAYGKADYVFHG